MGAWGMKSFENDMAMGFLYDIQEYGRDILVMAFNLPQQTKVEQLNADQASHIIAGAELLAGKFGVRGDIPIEARRMLTSKALTRDLVEPAYTAVSEVLKGSELKELWLEADNFEAWEKDVLDLLERLK
jgi:hypothetical protein